MNLRTPSDEIRKDVTLFKYIDESIRNCFSAQ
jgi:hypothetical protein